MRAICKVCKDKDNCSYLKNGREGDCIDVQTSDYGYYEAIEKVKNFLTNHIHKELIIFNEAGDKQTWVSRDRFIENLCNYMEE